MSDLGDPADGCGPPWAGRGLRLQHPPTPENGSAHAQTFVDAVSNIDGVNLDYSDASLEWVDGKLDHWRPEGSDVMAETVFVAGC